MTLGGGGGEANAIAQTCFDLFLSISAFLSSFRILLILFYFLLSYFPIFLPPFPHQSLFCPLSLFPLPFVFPSFEYHPPYSFFSSFSLSLCLSFSCIVVHVVLFPFLFVFVFLISFSCQTFLFILFSFLSFLLSHRHL